MHQDFVFRFLHGQSLIVGNDKEDSEFFSVYLLRGEE